VSLGREQRLLAVRRDVGGKPFFHEAPSNEARHPQVVLDDEHAHDGMVPEFDERLVNVRILRTTAAAAGARAD
jgi:hypothetical protein